MKEIRSIISAYENKDFSKAKLALASVVNVEESSYRRIGARMLVSSKGDWVGGISGGCLEGDALKRSQQAIYKNRPSIVVYNTLDNDSNQIGIGLGCNGKIEVLFTPIDSEDSDNAVEQLKAVVKNSEPSIMLKVIDSSGDKDLLGYSKVANSDLDDFSFCDTDNVVLKAVIKETRLKSRPQIIEINNKEGQVLKILVEYFRPETKLIIVGDNYDVNAFVNVAEVLGWEIYILCKKRKLSKGLYNRCQAVYDYEEIKEMHIDKFTAVVLMSHDFNQDKMVLPFLLESKPGYLGMLGPKKRVLKMQEELNINDLNKIPYFYSPVGLDIGAENPEEIALAIASEILANFRKREGASLKFRSGTIYDRN